MTKTMRCAAVALLLVCVIGLAGCRRVNEQNGGTNLPYVDDMGYSTRPTVYVPPMQMTMADLIQINDVQIPWSAIEPYTHTKEGDHTAIFAVADTYGEEATLTVVYDAASNTVSEATLSYEGLSASILAPPESLEPFVEIGQAMESKYK